MTPKYVVSHLDEQMGPFEEHDLKAKWVKGEILPIDYVYDESKEDWVLLSERFSWANGKAEQATPPPLREITVKKERVTEVTMPTISLNNGKPAPTPAKEFKKPTSQGAKVKLLDGIGEIDLSPLQPGRVEFVLQDSSSGNLKLQNPLKIQVKAAEPHSIEWTVPTQQICGQDIEIKVRALDKNGYACLHYDDNFLIRVAGPSKKEIAVALREGEAMVKVQHTKAELWEMTFHYSGNRALTLPESRTLEWQPGVASKLILDGPQEYVAGHPLRVQVKAVDTYGNLARTFQGTVILEVKAS